MLSVIVPCYHVPEQDMLDPEECDGESPVTSIQTANHTPTGCTACLLGCRYFSQAGPVWFLAAKASSPFLQPVVALAGPVHHEWVNLLSRQRLILSAVVSVKGCGKFSTKEGTGPHGSSCWEREAGKKREEAGYSCGDGKTICLVVLPTVSPGLTSAM